MKIRNGFVSNSSSSSFILIYKDVDIKCETCRKLFNLYFKNAASAEDVIREMYCYDDPKNYIEDHHDLLTKAYKEDMKVVYEEIDYDNEDYADVLCNIANLLNLEYEFDS